MWVQSVGLVVQVVPAFCRAHWVQVVQGAGASGVLRCVFSSSGRVFPAFCLFAAFAFLQYLLNMPYFAI